MAEEVGFTSMAGAKAEGEAPTIGIGMLGYAFMGKAHSNAFKKLPYMMYPPVAIPRLVAIAGATKSDAEAAQRYGYESVLYRLAQDAGKRRRSRSLTTAGRTMPTPNPRSRRRKAGKHVFCEKPLARTAEEAKTMLDAVEKAGVKHMVAFNYRFVPAIVQARKLIESGALGRIFHFRAVYLQEWIIDPNFPKVWRLERRSRAAARWATSARISSTWRVSWSASRSASWA